MTSGASSIDREFDEDEAGFMQNYNLVLSENNSPKFSQYSLYYEHKTRIYIRIFYSCNVSEHSVHQLPARLGSSDVYDMYVMVEDNFFHTQIK